MQWIAIASSLITASAPMAACANTAKDAGQALSLNSVVAAGQAPMMVPGNVGDISQQRLNAGLHKHASTNSHYEKGLYFKQHGEVDNALVEFLKATQEDPRLVKAYWEQALIFRDRGYLKLAQSALMQALTIKPDDNQARLLLAAVRLEQGDFSGCATDLSRMLGIQAPKFMAFKNSNDLPAASKENNVAADFENAPSVMQMPHYYLPVPSAEPAENPNRQKNQRQEQINAARRQLLSAEQNRSGQDTDDMPGSTRTISSSLSVSELLKGIPGIDPNATANGDTHSEVNSAKAEPGAAKSQESAQKPKSLLHFFFNPFSKPKTGEGDRPAVKSQAKADTAEELHKQQVEAIKRITQRTLASSQDSKAKLAQEPKAKQAKIATQPEAKKHAVIGWFSRWFATDDNQAKNTEMAKVDNQLSKPTTVLVSAPKPIALAQNKNSIAMVVHQQGQANNANSAYAQTHTVTKGNQVVARDLTGQVVRQATSNNSTSVKVSSPGAYSGQRQSNNVSVGSNRSSGSQEYLKTPASTNDKAEDPWTVRLRYLALNGTTSLKAGEAFVFSEETGDATLFLVHGQSVRRHVLPAQDPEDTASLRRPDIMHPNGVQYNLSLLGKLLPKKPSQTNGSANNSAPSPSGNTAVTNPVQGFFKQIMPF